MTTQQRRVANHECIICQRPLGDSKHVRCPDCMAYLREVGVGRYYQLREAHKCTQCGKPMPKDYYYVRCEKCRERGRKNENGKTELYMG